MIQPPLPPATPPQDAARIAGAAGSPASAGTAAGSAGAAPVLPLSAQAGATCRVAMAALGDPARRAAVLGPGGLAGPVAQALRLFDDPGLRAASGRAGGLRGPGPELRDRRRAVLQVLQRRHPDAVAAIRSACGCPRGGDRNFIIVDVYTFLIIITVGVMGLDADPFAAWDEV